MGRTTLKMPQLGESVTEGTVDRWLKQEGDMVHRDEPIVEVVTDKVNAEIPSPFEGKLVRTEVQPGQTVPIGAALAEIEVEGAVPAAPTPAPAATETKAEPPPAPQSRPEHERVQSRRANHLAKRSAAPPPPARTGERGDEVVRISTVRRQIAEHMVRSVTTSPHAWSVREVDVSKLQAYRESNKEEFQGRYGFALSYRSEERRVGKECRS